jgi:hypothetical protein
MALSAMEAEVRVETHYLKSLFVYVLVGLFLQDNEKLPCKKCTMLYCICTKWLMLSFLEVWLY